MRLGLRAALGFAALAACLPLLAGGALVATGADAPWLSALGTTLAVVAAVGARRLRLLAAALAGSLFLVFAGALLDEGTIRGEGELHEAGVGIPFDYVRFESSLTPPIFPYPTSWNPWEDPATVQTGPFLADWAIVGVPLVVAALLLPVLRSGRAER